MKNLFFVVIIFLSSCAYSQSLEGPYIVHSVVDGDTIDLEMGRIRLSGINTPESGECYYEEAKEKLKDIVLYQEIFLEHDLTDKDKYGRYLRYIYTNTTFVNGYLVAEGYARVFDKYNASTKYYDELKVFEKEAQTLNKGIWACANPIENCLYVASKNSNIYHRSDCKWAKRIKPENLICFYSEEELKGYIPSKNC